MRRPNKLPSLCRRARAHCDDGLLLVPEDQDGQEDTVICKQQKLINDIRRSTAFPLARQFARFHARVPLFQYLQHGQERRSGTSRAGQILRTEEARGVYASVFTVQPPRHPPFTIHILAEKVASEMLGNYHEKTKERLYLPFPATLNLRKCRDAANAATTSKLRAPCKFRYG